MGNSTSEHQARFFRTENLSNDPSAFRVFVKKKNKFIPGWLKINDDEIVFTRGGNHFQYWSLAHLRRYGYTCSGVFFFESGRRCATGEGLHTFQSHQAERIFHMVQSKIKIEEYARGSRAGSVASGRINSLVPTPSASSRIHPVQRFSSEGANNEYSPPNGGCLAPPPYSAFQDARRHQQNASPNCPSVITAVSSSAYARIAALRERPRSVVSNIEHNVVMPPMQQQQQQQFRHHHINPIQGNASSSTLLQHLLNQQQQQQHQQGFAMPPHMNSPLAGSSSGSCLMNQSYHSALGTGSPWASQQQLEGDIVMEHVLGDDGRRRVLPGGRQNTMPNGNNKAGGEPIRVAVPPSAKSPAYGTTTNFFGGGTKGCREQPHAYVNVNLPAGQQQGNGVGLNVRELHRTDRSRLEFLSTGPGAFQLPHYGSPNGRGTPNNNFYTPTPPPPAGGPSSAFAPPLPSAMQHSYHQQFYACTPTFTPPYHQQQQHQLQQHYFQNHQNLQMPREQHLMSQSVSGALPPFSGRHFVVKANEPSSLLYTSNSLEQIVPPNDGAMVPMLNYQYCPPDASKVASAGNGSEQAGLQGNNGSNSTLITSSSNTMATTTGS